jgi:hypothetical protein
LTYVYTVCYSLSVCVPPKVMLKRNSQCCVMGSRVLERCLGHGDSASQMETSGPFLFLLPFWRRSLPGAILEAEDESLAVPLPAPCPGRTGSK